MLRRNFLKGLALTLGGSALATAERYAQASPVKTARESVSKAAPVPFLEPEARPYIQDRTEQPAPPAPMKREEEHEPPTIYWYVCNDSGSSVSYTVTITC